MPDHRTVFLQECHISQDWVGLCKFPVANLVAHYILTSRDTQECWCSRTPQHRQKYSSVLHIFNPILWHLVTEDNLLKWTSPYSYIM